jgi:hypothetical protein
MCSFLSGLFCLYRAFEVHPHHIYHWIVPSYYGVVVYFTDKALFVTHSPVKELGDFFF